MEKKYFKNLLEDLYTIYNPGNLPYVDDLVERFNRFEFDALRKIFLMHNVKNASYYDPALGTDEHIATLINDYGEGKRTLQLSNLKEQGIRKNSEKKDEIKEITEKKIGEIHQESKEEIDQYIKNTEEKLGEYEKQLKELCEKRLSEIELMAKKFETKLGEIDENVQKKQDDCIIRVFSTHTNSEIDLPNKKIISSLGKGSRLIVYDENKKVIGLEVSDITCDNVSDMNGTPIIEVTVNKI